MTLRTSSPRRAKSAERMEGAIRNVRLIPRLSQSAEGLGFYPMDMHFLGISTVTIRPMPKYQFDVEVLPEYLPEQSAPDTGVFSFAYTITITNSGETPAQLISRHWIISDSRGHTEEVKGLGVVGHQPLLKPGESFQYTSGCRLRTSSGTMHGTFHCVAEDGEPFNSPGPLFVLEAISHGPSGEPLSGRVLHCSAITPTLPTPCGRCPPRGPLFILGRPGHEKHPAFRPGQHSGGSRPGRCPGPSPPVAHPPAGLGARQARFGACRCGPGAAFHRCGHGTTRSPAAAASLVRHLGGPGRYHHLAGRFWLCASHCAGQRDGGTSAHQAAARQPRDHRRVRAFHAGAAQRFLRPVARRARRRPPEPAG